MIRANIEYICPTCGKRISVNRPTDLPTRPFCSFRCKMIDLYKWLNEEIYIPHEPLSNSSEQNTDDGSID